MRIVAAVRFALLLCLACAAEPQPNLQELFDSAAKAIRDRDFASAERISRAGLDAAGEAGENIWAGRFEQSIGDSCLNQGRSKEAGAAYERALARFDQAGAKSSADALLLRLGAFHANLGNFREAAERLARARSEFAAAGDKTGAANALDLLGQVHAKLNRFDESSAELKEALTLFEAAGDAKREAKIRGSLADLYRRQSDFRAALEQGFRALEGDEKFEDRRETAKVLDVLGNTFQQIGQMDHALSYYQRALSLRETYSIKQDLAFSYKNLGAALKDAGRYADALVYSRKSLELARASGAQREIAGNLSNIAGMEQELGHVEQARQGLQESLALAEHAGLLPEQSIALYKLGNLAFSSHDLNSALELHKRALQIRESGGEPRDIVWSLNRLALVYEALGDLKSAGEAHQRALGLFEQIGAGIADPVQYGAYRQTSVVLYPFYARVLVKLGRPQEALSISERGRAVGLSRLTDLNRSNFAELLSPAAAASWRAAADAVSQASNQLRAAQEAAAASGHDEVRGLEEARAFYFQREREFAGLRDRLFASTPSLRAPPEAPPAIEQLTTLAKLSPETMFLEWTIVEEKSSLLFALSADGLRAFTLDAGAGELRDAATAWLASLAREGGRGVILKQQEAPPSDEQRLARKLYDLVFAKLEPLLTSGKYKRLVVVSEGPLLNIPFAALVDGGGKRLIDRYAISSSVSFGYLLQRPVRRKASKTLLAVADPLAPGESRLVAPSGDRYGSLQYAFAESKSVASIYPKSVTLAGSAAREANVKRLLPEFEFLHFATHGILDPRDGLRSGLLLAAEPRESSNDGILQAREIASMSLSAHLAVLSACQTGRGDERLGDGLLGLAWAFQSAGVPRVVASLWNVDDAATRALMTAFYAALKSASRVDEALRTASATLRKDPRYSSPYYWAPFQVIGLGGPVE